MTDNLNWETIDVPAGSFLGWGDKPGQAVTGVVLSYSPQGGKDFNQDPCPSLTLELLEEAYSHSKKQGWQKIDNGELVQLNCGQTSLKKAVMAAGISSGDLVKISLDEILYGQGQNNGDVKVFGIKIVRGYRRNGTPSAAQSEPSFGAPQPQPQFGVAQVGPGMAHGGAQPQPQPAAVPSFGGADEPPPF